MRIKNKDLRIMNYGKLLMVFISLFIIHYSLFTSSAYAAGASFTLTPNNATFNKGCSFSLNVVEDTGGSKSEAADAIILYDATRFKVLSVNTGTIYPEYPANIFDTAGKIAISGVASVDKPFSGAGTFATLNFQVLSEAPAGVSQIKFDFDPNDKTNTRDSNIGSIESGSVTDILSAVNNANVTVGSGSCGAIGGPGTASGSGTVVVTAPPTVLPTKNPVVLPPAGNNTNLWIIGGVGGMLTIIGVLGLVLL